MPRESSSTSLQAPVRPRCPRCERALSACFCARLRVLENNCPVLILQDAAEARHALGTAAIAVLGLGRCELIRIRHTDPASVADGLHRVLAQNPVLVYPGAEARPVSAASEPLQPLLFIDATWRKSRRLLLEHPALAALPRIALSDPPSSRYRLRRTSLPGAVSTLEAIVHTLATVEQSSAKYQPLLDVMDWMIQQQISHMSEATYRRNYERAPHQQG